ncbi:MAG: preprotein translocase subunit SecE [Patescibacteria group bacterium]|jgi:preprotein translocase subunit SecE|nr:preprotein translocase subunit SecE [Patescibacteria group bacterium]MDD5173044.1 preprotein translocase subunit SecE [Patescibacteria group bacterium]
MFQKFTNYIKNSIAELKKVSWPTKEQAINNTILVVGVSLGVAIFLGLIDFLLTKILQIVL